MTHDEFLEAASRLPHVERHEDPAIDPDARYFDGRHAMRDANMLRLGQRVSNPHPLASPEFSLERWAGLMGRSVNSSDFGDALSEAYGAAMPSMGASFDDAVGAVCRDTGVPDFKPMALSAVEIEPPNEDWDTVNHDIQQQAANASTGQLTSYGITLKFGRQLIVNDNRRLLDSAIGQAVSLLRRIDLQLIANILNSNPTLGDGQQLFLTGNSVSGGGHVAASLDTAIGELASQSDSYGNLSCAQPAAIMASADTFANYAKLASDLSPAINIRVFANAYLTASTAFIFADPAQYTVLARLRRLDRFGRMVQRPSIGPARRGNYNGQRLQVYYDTGMKAVSRLGVCRIAA